MDMVTQRILEVRNQIPINGGPGQFYKNNEYIDRQDKAKLINDDYA